MNAEKARLLETRTGARNWKDWGPYLSERQWGTVREDYSADGAAWDYFPHDHARSRTYRWGEDGIAGISDGTQRLCFSLALWNGRDAILKERLFGLTGPEGNHGEDVKEYYYYLDSTPTHSYMKMLYKYPQAAFPYGRLVEENRKRSRNEPEFELIDTGVLEQDRYFDVFVEYAKGGPSDMLVRITAHNRGPEAAPLRLLPQLWFRNTWAWGYDPYRPQITKGTTKDGAAVLTTLHRDLTSNFSLHGSGNPQLLFCDNDTNVRRLYGTTQAGYFKDAFHEYVVEGRADAVNPDQAGTKAALHYQLDIPPGECRTIELRLTDGGGPAPLADLAAIFEQRRQEADEFYAEIQADLKDDDLRLVQRQAFAGMMWSKQFMYQDVSQWLNGDPAQPEPPPERKRGRNGEWKHLNNADVISMPDKWEYPWFAAWDLAFHTIPISLIDPDFAKDQLLLLTREWYMHPNGQLPAYEWAFGDANPPVHAWAAWRVYQIDQKQRGVGDVEFLERLFHKMLLNFTWWVNRKDAGGNNIFQGGFLGLDNIGVFDRSHVLPTGGYIEQSDGTSWMAMYCLNLMRIALELSISKPIYQDMASKFFEHFLYIAKAMTTFGGDDGANLWNEQDHFYYDVLHTPDGQRMPMKVQSMVGFIPLFAVETLDPDLLAKVPVFKEQLEWFLDYRKDLAALVSRWDEPGRGERRLLSLLRGSRMKKLLERMLDKDQFLSDFGVRALSKVHEQHPYEFYVGDKTFTVKYQPGESDTGVFGGNSNWRGPIWFPVNYMIIEALQRFHHYYGDDFKIEYPPRSGKHITIEEVSEELSRRLISIFAKDAQGLRPVHQGNEKFQKDPHFRDYLLFYEYFHGDNGRGVGASHQSGWTGLVAKLMHPRAKASTTTEVEP